MKDPAAERTVVERSATPRRPHASRLERRARPARIQITPRDREILANLGVHRLLTSEQLHRLHFPRAQARRVRRRLRQLFDAKLVDRIEVVPQPQQGAPPFVYALSRDGAELAAEQLGTAPALPAASSPSLRFVAHHVGVCNFYVTLAEATRDSDWSIECWRHEWELKLGGEDGEKRAERIHVTDLGTEGSAFSCRRGP